MHRTHPSTVRAAVRPSFGRWMLIATAAATLGLASSSVLLAQQGAVTEQSEAVGAAVQPAVVADASASTLIAAPHVTANTAPAGPVLATGLVRYVPSASRSLDAPAVERMQSGPNLGRNVALVIVGVAAMIIGSDIGDTSGSLLVAGGAGMTLYGLYHIIK